MKPPYEITNSILKLISSISEKIGEIKSARLIKPPTELRKKNRIKTIQSSLEIVGRYGCLALPFQSNYPLDISISGIYTLVH